VTLGKKSLNTNRKLRPFGFFCLYTMKIEERLVTPAIANDLLQLNVNNRKFKEKIVFKYAKEMSENRWKRGTGEMIKIATDGTILDGQHRLFAVIKSNKSVYFHFALELDPSIYDVLDSGSLRNASDSFKIEGISNSNLLPALIQLKETLSKGRLDPRGTYNKLSTTQLLEEYHKREQFYNNVASKSLTWYSNFAQVLPPSEIGGFYAFFLDINKENAESFMIQLCTGADVTNSTILLLRNRLIQNKISLKKLPRYFIQVLIIKTWNFFRKNKEVSVLSFNPEKDDIPLAI